MTFRFVSEPACVDFTTEESVETTIQAELALRLNSCFFQQEQIWVLIEKNSYLANITLKNNSKQELLWWIKNLRTFNRASLLKQDQQVALQTGTSLTGWGAALLGKWIGEHGHFKKKDPSKIATDTMSNSRRKDHCYAFLPFRLISRVLSKIQQDQYTQ